MGEREPRGDRRTGRPPDDLNDLPKRLFSDLLRRGLPGPPARRVALTMVRLNDKDTQTHRETNHDCY